MSDVTFRDAVESDVPAIVALLADDALGATRETPGNLDPYTEAFALIAASPHTHLFVGERDGAVIATAQLTLMPGLSHQGRLRADIEAVRVAATERGRGLGSRLIEFLIATASSQGASMVQLTSNAQRTDARRFYERLGFTASHVGFKMKL